MLTTTHAPFTLTSQIVTALSFEGAAVRLVQIDGEPWFVAADVCGVLGLDNNRQAVSRLDDDEKGVTTVDTPSGAQQMLIINESGLYSLILTSRKPEAKRFKRWVTGEVLPTIRKTGGYGKPTAPAIPQTLAQALRLAADQADQIERQQATLAIAAPKAAFVDQYVQSTGLKGFRQVAKLLEVKENWFREFLADRKIMYRLGGEWTPCAPHLDAGRFKIKAGASPANGHAFNEAKFTPKGIEWIAGLMASERVSSALKGTQC